MSNHCRLLAVPQERKPRIRFFAFGIALTASLLASTGCSPNKGAADAAAAAPVEVEVAPVLVKAVRQWEQFNGRIGAVDSAEIRPRVSGYVEAIAYREGEEVQRGALLFKIDARPYRAALDSAAARLQRARANAVQARSQDQRAQTLLASNAISKEEAETRQANKLQGEADIRDADAAVAVAKLNLAFTEVRAPINGRASRAQLTVGNLARADETVLTTLVAQDAVYVYFDPDEKAYLNHAARARAAGAASKPPTVQVGLANEDDFPHAGVLDFFDNQVDPATGTIRARARLKNDARLFTPGLFARVRLGGDSATNAILIDEKAILTDQNRRYVYVVGADATAQRKDVTPGRSSDGLRVIDKGLAAGDKVVGGVQKIYASGTAIKPTEVPMLRPAN